MKVFKVSVKKFNWDEFDSCVIVAKDENAVRAMFEIKNRGERVLRLPDDDLYNETVSFGANQGDLIIEEVDLTKPTLVCASFNAG